MALNDRPRVSMENCRSEEGGDFSDAREDFSVACGSECGSNCSRRSRSSFCENDLADSLSYDFWIREPTSIDERRDEFLRRTGLNLERRRSALEGLDDLVQDGEDKFAKKAAESSKALEKEDSSTRAPIYGRCFSSEGKFGKFVGLASKLKSNVHRKTRSDVGTSMGSLVCLEDCKRRELVDVANLESFRKNQQKECWLKRIGSKLSSSSFKERRVEGSNGLGSSSRSRNPGIHVNPRRKQWKELSCLYQGQEFYGHKGYILTMKFSPDGKHLASGGQDGRVRIWLVDEDERSSQLDCLGFDSASTCTYISADGVNKSFSFKKKENSCVMRKLRKLPERACIVAPKKFFRISEKPLHDFHEHEGSVLDISWSERGSLLSASVDKTVRLWQVGNDRCLRIFTHHDFVTSVQFNPVDDNCFISGSIDGKVRIWSVLRWKVIHWIDVKEIVTAICYRPDGKGAIAGTIAGNCHFYDIADSHLGLDTVVCLRGGRCSSGKRINSLQFSPSDPSKLIVTSGDSKVRILSGIGVYCKLRGHRSGRMHMSASFTVDGKYVVSASADSNIHIWNCSSTSVTSFCFSENEIRSCETFLSNNAVLAIPWHGYRAVSQSQGLSTGLPSVVLPSLISEVDVKLFNDACQKMVESHTWGMVIVTGGSDGRIRAYHNYGLPVRR